MDQALMIASFISGFVPSAGAQKAAELARFETVTRPKSQGLRG